MESNMTAMMKSPSNKKRWKALEEETRARFEEPKFTPRKGTLYVILKEEAAQHRIILFTSNEADAKHHLLAFNKPDLWMKPSPTRPDRFIAAKPGEPGAVLKAKGHQNYTLYKIEKEDSPWHKMPEPPKRPLHGLSTLERNGVFIPL